MINWAEINTVLLDMDGTILDLHFDNHFWLEHLPKRYSEIAKISLEHAEKELINYYQKVEGTIDWYCLDYWAKKTQLPIKELKREVQHLIQLRDDAHDFLTCLRNSGREIVLVTNAHPDSLSLKIERTQLDKYFDTLYSTHEFGATKESQRLWEKLQNKHGFTLSSTLFIDDSVPVLQSAQQYGFQHLLAIANPDSKKSANDISGFNAITNYNTLLADIEKTAYHSFVSPRA